MGSIWPRRCVCAAVFVIHVMYYTILIVTVYRYYEAADLAAQMAKDGIKNFKVNSGPLIYLIGASALHAVISMLDVHNINLIMEMDAAAEDDGAAGASKNPDASYVRIGEDKDVSYALPFNSTAV